MAISGHREIPARTMRQAFRRLHRDLVGKRDALLREFKSKWPDNNYKFSIDATNPDPFDIRNQSGGDVQAIGFLRNFKKLNIGKTARIVDVGAGDNSMVEEFHKEGYTNSNGIDPHPSVLLSKHGRQLNFRDLPLHEIYDVICFAYLLSYFKGSSGFLNIEKPYLDLLAMKIACHLKPGGYLIFNDPECNRGFSNELRKLGFKSLQSEDPNCEVWQKIK